MRDKVAPNRPEAVVLNIEHWRMTEVERLHREFPALPIVCTHRVPDDEMWMAALRLAPATCAPADDVANVLTSVLRSMALTREAPPRRVNFCAERTPSGVLFAFDHSTAGTIADPRLLYSLLMLKETLEQGQRLTDAALERLIPLETQHPVSIHKAMRHSVFAGGKRLRPILCMEAGRMIAGSLPAGIEELGAALEMLHTYSLIHDDLPALDNDDLRRGRPTCHKVFGEAIAILAGDALQTQAYEVLAQLKCPAEARVQIIEEIARGTGTIDGMIGGQVVDLEAEHTRPTAEMLEYIHRSKTAALITASLVSGGLYAGAKEIRWRSCGPSDWRLDWRSRSLTMCSM